MVDACLFVVVYSGRFVKAVFAWFCRCDYCFCACLIMAFDALDDISGTTATAVISCEPLVLACSGSFIVKAVSS
jgi:hypothetical protein